MHHFATMPVRVTKNKRLFLLTAVLAASGVFVNWFAARGEAEIGRESLAGLPAALGEWRLKGGEIRFGADVEGVLNATDYTMREYAAPDGRVVNLYIGYYSSQRTGATYYSPQNCLPGAGWVLKDPQTVNISTSDGRTFAANRYFIENGANRELMIYWYEGRGRTEASEYRDKLNTVWDSVTRRRTDGAIVRVMTGVGSDEAAAISSATDLSARVAEKLSPFVPN
jgi:EpsI family protein